MIRRACQGSLGLVLVLAVSAFGQPDEPSPDAGIRSEGQKAVAATAEAYQDAFRKGDMKALEAFFAEDARLTTVDGVVVEGRPAILEFMKAGLEGNPGLSLRTEIRSIRLLGETTAVETGFSYTRTTADPVDDVVAYQVVHTKRDGTWRIFEIFEAEPALDAPRELHAEKLAALDFLAGAWLEESPSAEIEHAVSWSANHRWLTIDYRATAPDGKPVRVAHQRVGWDPARKTIRSWLFEEDGGHAEGRWTEAEDGRSWTVLVSGVLADGRSIASTLRFERLAEDRIRIVTSDRTVDDSALPDPPPRFLVRKPKSAPAEER